MYALKNKVQLIGNLGAKPAIKETENTRGEKVTDTQWHRVVAWGRIAEIAEKYLDKGREVAIEGKLINRTFNDKEGNKKYITEVQVIEILLLGSRTPVL